MKYFVDTHNLLKKPRQFTPKMCLVCQYFPGRREVIIIVSNWRHRPISDDSITRRIQRGDSIRFSACCLNFDTAALETNSGLNYDLIQSLQGCMIIDWYFIHGLDAKSYKLQMAPQSKTQHYSSSKETEYQAAASQEGRYLTKSSPPPFLCA